MLLREANAFLKRVPACEAPANYASVRGEASYQAGIFACRPHHVRGLGAKSYFMFFLRAGLAGLSLGFVPDQCGFYVSIAASTQSLDPLLIPGRPPVLL